jgi:hypothetical protein
MDANPRSNPRFATPEALAEFQKKEAEAARKGAHDMKVAALVITMSFVLVFVLVALVVIFGHIKLF